MTFRDRRRARRACGGRASKARAPKRACCWRMPWDQPRRDAAGRDADASSRRAHFEALIARRAAREPLAYITGHKEFWSLDFEVGPGVLVPRPETETLIEAALAWCPDRSAPLQIADLGTGSGAF